MLKFARWLILVAALMIAGCDEVTTQPTSPAPGQSEPLVQVPTRTLGPIVSYTPRFTATPIPSVTFTPSITPTATLTLVPPTITPTVPPTPTPTAAGVIRSGENVNLREGPGTDYPIAASVAPGTELGVVGLQVDEQGREWYKVAYTGEDGEVLLLWVAATLVETPYREIVQPVVTVAPTADGTPVAAGTPDRTAASPPTLEPDRVEVLAYCRQKAVAPPEVTTNDNVYIEWSWFVARPELMDDHLTHARYEVRLDGQLLDNWSSFASEIKREGGVWIVYWYYPVGKLSAGQHKIEFRLTWQEAISDGYKQFGPNTPNEADTGDCTFTVTEP